MTLVKCIHCEIFVMQSKDEFRRHEAKYHAYQSFEHELHHHIPLTKEKKLAIVAKGESRLGRHNFIGFGTEEVLITGPVSL